MVSQDVGGSIFYPLDVETGLFGHGPESGCYPHIGLVIHSYVGGYPQFKGKREATRTVISHGWLGLSLPICRLSGGNYTASLYSRSRMDMTSRRREPSLSIWVAIFSLP